MKKGFKPLRGSNATLAQHLIGIGSAGNSVTGSNDFQFDPATKELYLNGKFNFVSTIANGIFTITNNVVNNTDMAIWTADGLATNSVQSLRSNSANIGVRSIANFQNQNVAAINATPMEAINYAPTLVNYFRQIKLDSAGVTKNTIWQGNGTDANGTLPGTAGDILINGLNNRIQTCTGGMVWV